MLAAGTAASAAFSAFTLGKAVLAPALRDEYGLSLTEVGVLLATDWAGTLVMLLLWGIAADRFGERIVLAVGLGACGAFVCLAAYAPTYTALLALFFLAGATGASVNSASGRAVMYWFGEEQRGLALGVRQTAIPLGGLAAAFVLPFLAVEAAFLALGATCLAGAAVGWLVLREREVDGFEPAEVAPTLRDRRLWQLCLASGLFVVAQMSIIGFVVLFLHDEHGFSTGAAAAVLGMVQVLAAGLRIAVGRWSDVVRARTPPLRRIGVATALALGLVAGLAAGPSWLLIPAIVVAGGLSMAWNGLSFTAAAELAGRARSGAAIGFQQSVLSAMGVGAPVAFAALVAATSWRSAYALAAVCPFAGALALRRLHV